MPKRQEPPQPTRVEIEADASMPAVLGRVRRHTDETVVLAIPDHCPVLLTVAEFRALKDTADRAGVTLIVDSRDSLRAQLASMFGIRTTGSSQRDAPGWRPPDTLLGNTRSYDTWVKQVSDEEPPRKRRRRDSDSNRAAATDNNQRTHRNKNGAMDYIEDDTPSVIGATARKVGTILAVVLVAGLIATIAGWYALPNVTIVATVKSTEITSEVNYAVAAEGAALPSDIEFTAPATEAEADVPFTISVPTTGVNRTPQDTATGNVLLRNPTAEEIVMPQGTSLTIYQGSAYTTDSDVTVPPASNNVAGETTVAVTATAPGTVGNAEPGMVTGVVADLGVHYSNRDAAIEGGTDIEVPIVAEADIQALTDKIVNEHQRAAAIGWNSQLPDGQSVVEPSVESELPTYTIEAQPGDQAEEISVSGTVRATGLIYDQTVVTEETTSFFRESLAAQVPEGYEIDPSSVVLGEPLALAPAPDNVQFRVSATATAYAVVNDAASDGIRDSLAGSSWDEAQAELDGVEQFENYDLSISPGWWFKRMPQDGGRIDLQIADPLDAPATPSPRATVEN